MKSHNVIWILVDSVRNYHSEGDDRGRLAIMDEFSKESVEFLNCVTSAPSTVMSISAMMTSLPAYYLGRNYTEFRFDTEFFLSFNSILKRHNYACLALIRHREIREKLRGLFDLVPRKYWPDGLSHGKWWSNRDINQLMRNILRHYVPRPSFWFFDYNCRQDPAISDLVADAIHTMEEVGYTGDNTIYILCSDHGYPDPGRGFSPEQLKQRHMSHDMFMTDDNILIPLIIRYPGCPPSRKIEATVSSLDILPTLLDILSCPLSSDEKARLRGKSLLPLIEGKALESYRNPMIRTDARFLAQSRRVTAIRSDRFKYIIYHDTGEEEFIDIRGEKLKEINIINQRDPLVVEQLKDFRDSFQRFEQDATGFQVDYATYRLNKQFAKFSKYQDSETPLKVLILTYSEWSFINAMGRALKRSLNNAVLDLVSTWETGDKEGADCFNRIYCVGDEEEIPGAERSNAFMQNGYDLIIIPYDTQEEARLEGLLNLSRRIDGKKVLMLDVNMNIYINKGQLARHLRTVYMNREFYFQEPALIIHEIKRVIRAGYRRAKSYLFAR
jgi:hypothetical protein